MSITFAVIILLGVAAGVAVYLLDRKSSASSAVSTPVTPTSPAPIETKPGKPIEVDPTKPGEKPF